MKKLAVIAAMVLLSVATITACGNKEDKTKDNQTSVNDQNTPENDTDENTPADNTDDANPEEPADNTDDTNSEEPTENPEDANTNDENNGTDKKDTDKKGNEQKELVETGKEPDFKLNKKGCFNGSYEGNDGCIYKFTKKGKLIITSDSETMKYEYRLDGDVLGMIAEDGSFGTSRQITLLEDGTYLLDDTMGTQVILTYTGGQKN